MLISKDSPLRRISIDVEPRTVLFLDGIRYSIEIMDAAFHRLERNLEQISRRNYELEEFSQRIVGAISDAWVIIDSTHRLRELIQQLPGLKQKDANVQLFLRNTEEIEVLRHFVQHFRSGIDSFVAKRMPLWGTISWSRLDSETNEPESHSIIPGTFYHGVQAVGCEFDSQEWKFIDRIIIHAGETRIDLANVHDRVARFLKWFESWCSDNFVGEEHHGADVHYSIGITESTSPLEGGEP